MKNVKFINKYFVIILLLFAISMQMHAIMPTSNDNRIHDPENTLSFIFNDLRGLELKQSTLVIPILHIGDSHLQSGILTERIRIRLQQKFGNAGRGLIVPIRLSGSNQPLDYSIRSSSKWIGGRCTQSKKNYPYGISGFAVKPLTKSYSLDLEVHNSQSDIKYDFRKIMVLHSGEGKLNANTHNLLATDSLSPDAYYLKLKEKVMSITLTGTSISETSQGFFHGFSLENDSAGILYHTVGVNGATYQNYCGLPLFIAQSTVLQPRLIIISLGTNEAFGRNFCANDLYSAMDKLIGALRKANPLAVFLLTTPAEDFKKVRKRHRSVSAINPKIGLVAQAIVNYATQHKIAYWDLFAVTGGSGSAKQWASNQMMGRDKIHFNESGYQLQGELFVDAFLKLYNEHR